MSVAYCKDTPFVAINIFTPTKKNKGLRKRIWNDFSLGLRLMDYIDWHKGIVMPFLERCTHAIVSTLAARFWVLKNLKGEQLCRKVTFTCVGEQCYNGLASILFALCQHESRMKSST